jgi:hypothetical protein
MFKQIAKYYYLTAYSIVAVYILIHLIMAFTGLDFSTKIKLDDHFYILTIIIILFVSAGWTRGYYLKKKDKFYENLIFYSFSFAIIGFFVIGLFLGFGKGGSLTHIYQYKHNSKEIYIVRSYLDLGAFDSSPEFEGVFIQYRLGQYLRYHKEIDTATLDMSEWEEYDYFKHR